MWFWSMLGTQVFGLVLELIGTLLIISETIKGPEYKATRTEAKDYPKYYDVIYDEKGCHMNGTSFPKQWKRLILWLSIIVLGVLNQIVGLLL